MLTCDRKNDNSQQVDTHTDIRLDGSIFDGCHSQCTQNTHSFTQSKYFLLFRMCRAKYIIFFGKQCIQVSSFWFWKNMSKHKCRPECLHCRESVCVLLLIQRIFISRLFEFYAFNLIMCGGSC